MKLWISSCERGRPGGDHHVHDAVRRRRSVGVVVGVGRDVLDLEVDLGAGHAGELEHLGDRRDRAARRHAAVGRPPPGLPSTSGLQPRSGAARERAHLARAGGRAVERRVVDGDRDAVAGQLGVDLEDEAVAWPRGGRRRASPRRRSACRRRRCRRGGRGSRRRGRCGGGGGRAGENGSHEGGASLLASGQPSRARPRDLDFVVSRTI